MRRDDGPADDLPADYDRPHQRWVCGLEPAGCPCPSGPTPRGRCPGASECLPQRDGDRWVCNRSDQRGGPCPDGPTPDGACCRVGRCRPRPSVRASRARWLTAAAALATGGVLVILGSADRNDVIVPGPLTSHHAQVIAGASSARCASCHPGANAEAVSLVAAGITGAPGGPATQSSLCLDCHDSLRGLGADPLGPHGLPADSFDSAEALASTTPDATACAVCHQEHHGPGHDLTAISDRRCQSCHADRYGHFADDHPDFVGWPTRRRTRIAFNHASHERLHFEKEGQAFDCRTCHVTDATGDLTARPPYDVACGGCHEAGIAKSFADGIPLVALPTLDDTALDPASRTLRDWPAAALGDFDGDPPTLMKLLLAADADAAAALGRLGPGFSFFDIDPADASQVADAEGVAHALRTLLNELQDAGHAGLGDRIERLTDAADAPLADLVSRLPVELVDLLQAAWFEAAELPLGDAAERNAAGGWFLYQPSFSLRYRPTGHDDPFLRAWIDVVVSLPDEHAALREACLDDFLRPGAPGACLTCHSVDRAPDGRPVVHWRGRDRQTEPRGFTFFSHRPHVAQPLLADCSACHALDPAADLRAVYAGGDPRRFRSEFVALAKSACVDCHRPHAAGDGCTQCHNYHAEAGGRLGD